MTLDVYRTTEDGEGELYEKVNLTADSWSATLENVPLYDLNGNAYIYYIHGESATNEADADDLALYNTTFSAAITPADGESALAATNTLDVDHDDLAIDIPVRKDWVDNGGERPAVTIQLLAGGEVVKGIELTGAGESAWSHTFEDLPKYALVDGKVEEITYSVKEASVPEGYTADNGGAAVKDEDGVYVVTNRIAEGETSVTVTKTWDVPSYVTTNAKATFTLYRTTDAVTSEIDVTGMTPAGEATIAYGDETQSHTWSGLPANDTDSGKPWNYVVVEEVNDANFTGAGAKPVTDSAVAFTNTYKSGDAGASLTVTKRVEGALSGENPSFTFRLTLGNKPVGGVTYKVGEDERTTGEDGSFTLMAGETATFPGLAVGEYTVTETETNGWTADESRQTAAIAEGGKAALTFTNTRAMDASVKVTKTWVDDADKADVTRPQLIFSLYGKVGGKYLRNTGALTKVETAYETMTADGGFTEGTFDNLPEYAADGAEIAWTVEETMADNGFAYASTSAETAEGFAFTNTLKTMDVVVNKTWVLNGIALETYPTVTLGLYADGVEDPIATATLENGAATATFEDVPYRASGYTVRETIGEDGEFAGIENKDLTVKELFTEQEEVVGDPVEQEDGSYRAEASLTNTAMIDGETAGAITVSKTIDLNGTTWTGEYPAFSFTAEWVDSEGETHTVELSVQPTQEHEPADSAQIIAPVGEDVTVTETVPAGWTAEPAERTVRVEAIERQAAFVNTRETVNALTVTKTWNTNGVQIATPDVELTIGRIADGMDAYENVTTVTFEEQEGDTWTETLTGDFPTHDESGNAYTYAVIGERALNDDVAAVLEQYTPDYTATAIPANGETALGATNTIGDVVTVTIEKNVVDPTRETVPDKFTINYAVADAEGNTLFTGGPVTLGDGEKATIAVPSGATVTVTEDTTAAWDVAYENNDVAFTADGTITVTNTRKLTSLDVTKTWVDNGNAGETRPTAEEFAGWFTLYCQAGENTEWEVVEETPTVSEDLTRVTYDNLPKYNAQGVKYTYAAEETPTDEYAIMSISNGMAIVLYDGSSDDGETHLCVVNGETITNRLEATVPVTIEKQWLDGDGKLLGADYIPDGTIQVQLYQNGEREQRVELSAENGWTTTVNVAKYDGNGAKYTYSVAETALVIGETTYPVEGGEIAVDGITYTVGAKATEDDYAFIVTNARGDEPEVKPEKDLDEDNSDLTIYDEDKQMVDVGDELTYTIRWDNYTSKAQTITITDTLPTGLAYVSATKELEGVNAEITDFAVNDQTVSWTIAAQPFASGTVSLTAKVTEDALTGEASPTVQNKATVTLGKNRYDIETEPTTVSNAAIDVEKRIVNGGETPYELGDAIEYEVVVTNTGNVTLKDIEFTDALYDGANLPDGAAMSDGKIVIAELAPQKSITFEYSHVVTSDDILNGEVPNTATATADDPTKDGGEKVTDFSDQSAELEDVKAGVEVEKTTETAGPVAAGETIAYTIVVRNTGNVALHNVKVVDHLEGIVYVENGTFTVENGTATINTIPAYGSVKLTATYTVTEADVAAGHVRNAVTVTTDPVPDPDQPDPHKPTDEDEIDTPTQPTKSVDIGDGTQVEVGGKLTYTISYYNPYDAEATVTITDVLDPGVRFDSATDGGTETNGTVTWTIANVQPHSAGSVQVTVVVTDDAKLQQAGEDVAQVANLADVAVRTEEQGYEGTTNRVVNPLAPDEPQAPTKSVDVGDGSDVKVGDVLTYTISYYNHNNAKAAVTILDELDPGVTFIEASDGGENIGGVVTWTIADVPALTAGSVTLKVQVNESAKRIDEDETTATVENDAQVGIGGDKAVGTNVVVNPIASESGDAQQPVKAATQVAGEPFAEGTTVKVGDEITYRIDYRNFTNSRATVTITDVLDPGVELVADEAPAYTYDEAARTLTWEMETEPFTDGSVTFTVRVTEAARLLDAEDKARATVDNLANVAVGEWSKDTNEVVIDVADDVPTEPTKTATEIDDVVITAEGAEVAVGETITYEIAYTNHTNDVVNVAIADALDAGVDFVEASDGGAYSASDRTVYWQIENVAPFTSGTVTLTVRVNETAKEIGAGETMATVGNTAYVDIGNAAHQTSNPVEIELEDDEPTAPTKTATQVGGVPYAEGAEVAVGETITYEIAYTNHTAHVVNVAIADALDAGVDFVEASDGGAYSASDRTVYWQIENVAPFTSGTVTLTVRVNETAKEIGAGETMATVDNMANVAIGALDPAPTGEVVIPVESDDPETTTPEKTYDEIVLNEFGMIEVGDEITYRISYYNNLNVPATVTITDALDAGLDYVSSDNGGRYDAEAHAVTWALENVAPFTGGTVTLTVRVNESALDAAFPTVDNTAIAQVGNQVGFDSDPVEIPVYNPDVEIDKALVDERPVEEQKDYYAVGETVTFTITVANTGNVTLNDLIIIDEIDAAGDAVIVPGEGYAIDADGNAVIESLEPGETVVVRAEYVVQAGDVGGEPIVNRAYAVAPDPTGDPDKPDVGDGDEEPFTPDKATAMSGEKIWNDQGDAYGMRPQAITVRLYADGEEYAVQTVTARDDWAYAFTGLPTHHADGTAIRYTIAEDAVAGYDTTYIAVDGSHWNIRNDLRQPAPVDIDPNGVSLNIGFVTMNVGDCFE